MLGLTFFCAQSWSNMNYQFPVLITANMGSNFKPREGEGPERTMTISQN